MDPVSMSPIAARRAFFENAAKKQESKIPLPKAHGTPRRKTWGERRAGQSPGTSPGQSPNIEGRAAIPLHMGPEMPMHSGPPAMPMHSEDRNEAEDKGTTLAPNLSGSRDKWGSNSSSVKKSSPSPSWKKAYSYNLVSSPLTASPTLGNPLFVLDKKFTAASKGSTHQPSKREHLPLEPREEAPKDIPELKADPVQSEPLPAPAETKEQKLSEKEPTEKTTLPYEDEKDNQVLKKIELSCNDEKDNQVSLQIEGTKHNEENKADIGTSSPITSLEQPVTVQLASSSGELESLDSMEQYRTTSDEDDDRSPEFASTLVKWLAKDTTCQPSSLKRSLKQTESPIEPHNHSSATATTKDSEDGASMEQVQLPKANVSDSESDGSDGKSPRTTTSLKEGEEMKDNTEESVGSSDNAVSEFQKDLLVARDTNKEQLDAKALDSATCDSEQSECIGFSQEDSTSHTKGTSCVVGSSDNALVEPLLIGVEQKNTLDLNATSDGKLGEIPTELDIYVGEATCIKKPDSLDFPEKHPTHLDDTGDGKESRIICIDSSKEAPIELNATNDDRQLDFPAEPTSEMDTTAVGKGQLSNDFAGERRTKSVSIDHPEEPIPELDATCPNENPSELYAICNTTEHSVDSQKETPVGPNATCNGNEPEGIESPAEDTAEPDATCDAKEPEGIDSSAETSTDLDATCEGKESERIDSPKKFHEMRKFHEERKSTEGISGISLASKAEATEEHNDALAGASRTTRAIRLWRVLNVDTGIECPAVSKNGSSNAVDETATDTKKESPSGKRVRAENAPDSALSAYRKARRFSKMVAKKSPRLKMSPRRAQDCDDPESSTSSKQVKTFDRRDPTPQSPDARDTPYDTKDNGALLFSPPTAIPKDSIGTQPIDAQSTEDDPVDLRQGESEESEEYQPEHIARLAAREKEVATHLAWLDENFAGARDEAETEQLAKLEEIIVRGIAEQVDPEELPRLNHADIQEDASFQEVYGDLIRIASEEAKLVAKQDLVETNIGHKEPPIQISPVEGGSKLLKNSEMTWRARRTAQKLREARELMRPYISDDDERSVESFVQRAMRKLNQDKAEEAPAQKHFIMEKTEGDAALSISQAGVPRPFKHYMVEETIIESDEEVFVLSTSNAGKSRDDQTVTVEKSKDPLPAPSQPAPQVVNKSKGLIPPAPSQPERQVVPCETKDTLPASSQPSPQVACNETKDTLLPASSQPAPQLTPICALFQPECVPTPETAPQVKPWWASLQPEQATFVEIPLNPPTIANLSISKAQPQMRTEVEALRDSEEWNNSQTFSEIVDRSPKEWTKHMTEREFLEKGEPEDCVSRSTLTEDDTPLVLSPTNVEKYMESYELDSFGSEKHSQPEKAAAFVDIQLITPRVANHQTIYSISQPQMRTEVEAVRGAEEGNNSQTQTRPDVEVRGCPEEWITGPEVAQALGAALILSPTNVGLYMESYEPENMSCVGAVLEKYKNPERKAERNARVAEGSEGSEQKKKFTEEMLPHIEFSTDEFDVCQHIVRADQTRCVEQCTMM